MAVVRISHTTKRKQWVNLNYSALKITTGATSAVRKRELLGNVAALSALHNVREGVGKWMELEPFYTYASGFC